jgi:tol-pal system protein YbgF
VTAVRGAVGILVCFLALAGCASGRGWMPWARSDARAGDSKPATVVELPAATPPVEAPPPGRLRTEEEVSRLASEMGELQNALAKLVASSRRQDAEIQAIHRRLGELAARGREGGAPAPPGFAPSPAEPGPSPGTSSAATPADDLFQTAMAKLRAGDRDAATLLFYEVIANYPTHPLRESAQLQVGDLFLGQKDYRGALAEFESLLAAAPRNPKAPEVLVKIGLCRRALGDETRARRVWERVRKEYPGSPAARQAQALLRGSPRR